MFFLDLYFRIKIHIKDLLNLRLTQEDLRQLGMKIGYGTSFYEDFYKHSEPYLIEVGNNCQITEGVKAFTHGGAHVIRNINSNFDTFGKVRIGNWCYIGNNALIMPGVTIGDNVLVAAGSVVTKSIPANVVVAGNPARIICSVADYLKKNLQYNTKTKGMSSMKKKEVLLSLSDANFVAKDVMTLLEK